MVHPIIDSVNARVSGNGWICVCGNQAATGNFCSICYCNLGSFFRE